MHEIEEIVDEAKMDQCVEPNNDGCLSYYHPKSPFPALVLRWRRFLVVGECGSGGAFTREGV
jgi:hypothetical protein